MRITEMMALEDSRKGYGQPSGNAGLAGMFINQMKEQQDEKRRQENVKKQLSNAQQMMQTMSQMPDSSASGKAVGTLNDDADKRRKGVISVSDYVPQQEMSVDENGMLNMKIGYRRATPQEQKAQFETKKAQMDMERAQAKSDLLNAYAQGKVQEGAILGEMATLGITPEEFDMASQARERMRQIVGSQTFSGQPVQIPQEAAMSMAGGGMGDVQGTPIPMAQPQVQPQAQEQGFRFKPTPMAEVKAQRDMERENKADSIKSQNAIDRADSTIKTIDHLITNKNYFGPLEGRVAPVFGGKIEFDRNFKNLQANAVMDVLSEMKSQSRTGATGFGALNEKELSLIMDAASKLDTRLNEATAEKYLNEMKVNLQKIIDREKNGYEGQQQGGQQSAQDSDSVPSVGGTFNGEKVISVKRIK
jgi:hypothetical protein